MIIKIKSENKYLLDILYKNPLTDEGLYLKELKNGILIGNVISENEYHCLFQDSKYSYMPEEANQIDFQSFCSPLLALNMGTEFFNHLYKEESVLEQSVISWLDKTYQEVDAVAASIEVSTFFIDSGWYTNGMFLLSKYIDGISLTHKTGNNFSLEIKGNSVREAVQKLSMVSLFVHFTNRYAVYTYIDDSFIQKYLTIITNIKGVPYFVFYLFIKRILRSPKQFDMLKPTMESYFDNQVQFVFTDTHQSRKAFICDRINLDQQVLDFGCGEMQYFKQLLKKDFRAAYFAYDEEDFKSTADTIIEQFKAENLFWVANREEITGFEGQIILSEVIEHNTLDEAKELLIWIRDNTNFSQLFITTPNKEFNVNYEMVDEFRHDDHNFELSKKEFIDLVATIFDHRNEYFGIGDCVNGVHPTSAIIIYSN